MTTAFHHPAGPALHPSSRSTGYALAKQDEYPVTALRLGNACQVVTADLHPLLGITPESAAEPAGAGA
ncbi:hypothetical protein [Streptomyces jumonjinensis]|uniref:hypothetical protein n=1 Tax=Streptomyces jumonjinensis TaxID=1945 RepID=UPI002B1E9737|nr:hypothetical protein [Streptomyces jumonjinensis]